MVPNHIEIMADIAIFRASKRGKQTVLFKNYEYWKKRTKAAGQTHWRCWLKTPGTKGPWDERSVGRKVRGRKVRGRKVRGTKGPGTKGPGTKGPGTKGPRIRK